jgi:membrane-anchored protein YejM (alkaline phosphatase superfamily)
MRADQLTALTLVIAILVVPALLYAVWRWMRWRARLREAREMGRGNKIYGEWRQSRDSDVHKP